MAKYFVGGIMASSNDIFHYGVKGMKWGVRRYQNADGSYTSAGKKRYKTFAQLKKDYPELDFEPTFPETNRPGGLTSKELDDVFKKIRTRSKI